MVTAQAAEKAQEAAQAAAEAQAAQLAAEAAKTPPAAPGQATGDVVGGTCIGWLRAAGVTDITDAMTLINMESGCNPNSVNPSSGSCGIGQQLPCGKWPHAWNDPVGSIIDMQAYVFARYGSWAAAVQFHYANDYY